MCVTWSAKCYSQLANIVPMPTQTTRLGRQYEVEFHYHQRGRATSKLFGPIAFVHHVNDLRATCDHVKYVEDCTIWVIMFTFVRRQLASNRGRRSVTMDHHQQNGTYLRQDKENAHMIQEKNT